MDEEIRELYDNTARTRYQFLTTELQTCVTALEMARFEFSIGNSEVVQKEVAFVEKGISTIQRFLPEVSPEQRTELKERLVDLKATLDPLKAEFNARRP